MANGGNWLNRVWRIIKYQIGTTNCFNCAHADKSKWRDDGEDGICNLLAGKLPFKITRRGICMHHSAFGSHGNVRIRLNGGS